MLIINAIARVIVVSVCRVRLIPVKNSRIYRNLFDFQIRIKIFKFRLHILGAIRIITYHGGIC